MGIFSSKKKYTVNVTVQSIFEESQIPSSVTNGVMTAIIGETDIREEIMEQLIAGMGIKANTGYNWAKNKPYAAGMPTATVQSTVSAKSAVLNAISANEGQAVSSMYYYFGPYNSIHYGWQYLVNTYGYDPATNEIVGLSAETGAKCYLANMVATYTAANYEFITETYDSGVLTQFGPSPTSGYTPSKPMNTLQTIGQYASQTTYEVSDTAVDDYLTITYEFANSDGTFTQRGITVTISGIDDAGDYHQVRYQRADGVQKFFTYLNGSGTYPTIDSIYKLNSTTLGTFYPWMYLRVNNDVVNEDTYPDLYADCKKWGTYLGVDFDTMSDTVQEDEDVDDVAQCILQLGLSPSSTYVEDIEYLFKHFSLLYESSLEQSELADTLSDQFLAYTSSPSQAQVIADDYFTQTLKYSGITKKRVSGTIGSKGTYTTEYGVVDQDQQNFVKITTTGVVEGDYTKQKAFIYRYQVLDSTYEEIAVYGLSINYDVNSHKGYGAGAGDDALLIPLDREVMRTISTVKREKIVCRAMHMLVNTVVITTTHWYESSAFKWIMIIIAVVITILSFGSAWQTLAAAAALGYTALAIAVLNMIVQILVVNFAVKLFVQAVGPELGMLAAIVAVAYGAYSGMSTASSTQAMWAERLVQVGTALSNAASEAIQEEVNDIAQDIKDFADYATKMFDALEETRANLGLDNYTGFSGDDLLKAIPDTVFGEAPTDFFSRTVHSGNIGAQCFNMVEYYVDYAVELPALNDTIDYVKDPVQQFDSAYQTSSEMETDNG